MQKFMYIEYVYIDFPLRLRTTSQKCNGLVMKKYNRFVIKNISRKKRKYYINMLVSENNFRLL